MHKIVRVSGREILDSRGRPTVLARCWLEDGFGEASVPSGASTGMAEARELRDEDANRYGGHGCLRAVEQIKGEIQNSLAGVMFASQAELDQRLIAMDGSSDKSRLGANAILAVSLAFARASASAEKIELWEYFSHLISVQPQTLPRLIVNLFSGGMHAGQQVPVQDVMVVPIHTRTIHETMSTVYDIYYSAAELARNRYQMRLLRADEGGLAPPFQTPEEMLDAATEAIEAAGYRPGEDVTLAIDVASSHFYSNGRYRLGTESLTSDEMVARLERWAGSYPIFSVEDGLAESDWDSWPLLMARLGHRLQIVGDDLLCTNASRIRQAVSTGGANSLLLKVNQTGTLTEAANALQEARTAGWSVVLSVRSGETEDCWAADLAVGWGAEQFKNGSITQSERLCKINRLLEIEEMTGWPVTPLSKGRQRA
jgi:enolase